MPTSPAGPPPAAAGAQPVAPGHDPVLAEAVRLARVACQTPMAMVTELDGAGPNVLAGDGALRVGTPRELALCQATVLSGHPLVVPDATADVRFVDATPVADRPAIRYYLGTPLADRDGRAFGALCVMDVVARHPRPGDVEVLQALSAVVEERLELRQLNRLHHPLEVLTDRVGAWLRAQSAAVVIVVDVDGLAEVAQAHGPGVANRAVRDLETQLLATSAVPLVRLPDAERWLLALRADPLDVHRVAALLGAGAQSAAEHAGLPLRCTIGYAAAASADDVTVEQLIGQAGAALRHALGEGPRSIRCYDEVRYAVGTHRPSPRG